MIRIATLVLVGGGRWQGRKEAGSHWPMGVGTTKFGPKLIKLRLCCRNEKNAN